MFKNNLSRIASLRPRKTTCDRISKNKTTREKSQIVSKYEASQGYVQPYLKEQNNNKIPNSFNKNVMFFNQSRWEFPNQRFDLGSMISVVI